MIRSYKYLNDAEQYRLHETVMAFFNRIEFESGPFKDEFLGGTLGMLASRHREIIRNRCEAIYNELITWDRKRKTDFFNCIRESNEIEHICEGAVSPMLIDKDAVGFNELIRDFFLDLYNQVLDGKPFNELFSTALRNHFDNFNKLNADVTLCPICGIGELKKHTDNIRDQYDHYLPKTLYPLSAVNFKNLVPVCMECNSLQVKGDTDIIAVSISKKLFFLFDTSYRGLTLRFEIVSDNVDPNKIIWNISFVCPDGKQDEIESWKIIYKIESRYIGYVNARVEKWYRHYWDFINDSDLAHLSLEDRKLTCMKSYEKDETLGLAFIRKPALDGFLNTATLSQAAIEASRYSIPPTA